MIIYDDIIQGSEAWDAIRLGRVTASNFPDVLALGKGQKKGTTSASTSKGRRDYMIKLVAERLTGLPSESYSNKAMERGSETEQEAREYYEALNGVTVRQVGFIARDDDVGGSPDGLVGNNGMIEIKCPFPTTHLRYILAGKEPTDYAKQDQGNLWVAEREWIDFISYDPRVRQRPFFCKRVYRNEPAIKELHIKIIMFVDEMKAMLNQLTKEPF